MRDSVYCGAEAKRAREFESEILPGVEIMRVAGRLGVVIMLSMLAQLCGFAIHGVQRCLKPHAGGAALGLV